MLSAVTVVAHKLGEPISTIEKRCRWIVRGVGSVGEGERERERERERRSATH